MNDEDSIRMVRRIARVAYDAIRTANEEEVAIPFEEARSERQKGITRLVEYYLVHPTGIAEGSREAEVIRAITNLHRPVQPFTTSPLHMPR